LWRRLRVTRRSAAVCVSGGDASVKDWRGERVGELRGTKSELLAGLIWGGEGRRSEFDGAKRKTAAMAEVVVFWSLGSGKRRETARNRVLGCHWFWSAREIELRGSALLGPRRRRGGSRAKLGGGAWQSGEGTSAKEEGGEELGRDAWSSLTAGGGAGAALHGGRHCALLSGGEQAGRQTGEGEKGPKRNIQIFQGPFYKVEITFKIGLK
jgi:hypothetical protein